MGPEQYGTAEADLFAPGAPEWPSVSVIVPCKDEERYIEACLRSLLAQAYRGSIEVIAVDGMSDDDTLAILHRLQAELPGLRIVENAARTAPAGLNRGVAAGDGAVIVRADAHAVFPPTYVEQLIVALRTNGAACVGGVLDIQPSGKGPMARAMAASLTHPFGVGNSRFRVGSSSVMDVDTVAFGCWLRTTFDDLGGFDETLARSQDMDFSSRLRRAGGRILLDPSIRATYFARSSLRGTWRYNFGNGYWVTFPRLAHGVRFSVRHYVPAVFVSALVVGAVARSRPLMTIVGGSYLLAAGAASADAARRRRDPVIATLLPVVFAALHLSYGVGELRGVVDGAMARLRGRVASASRARTPPSTPATGSEAP